MTVNNSGLEAIRAARRDLDAVIEEIREVPGYKQFLAVPTFDDVARAADLAPLVYSAAAEIGGLALVVRGDDVQHVPLDDLTADVVRDRVTRHLDAYTDYRAGRSPYRALAASLDDVTSWLWTAVVGPVLGQLGAASEAVFVTGGLLGLLPLHAAWTPNDEAPTRRRYAVDQLTISYAPDARALHAARDMAARTPTDHLFVVVDPAPVSAEPLRYAATEAAAARGSVPRSVQASGGAATRLAFERKAVQANVLHLICHGIADLRTPLDSGLVLAGNERIMLRDLFDLPLQVRLAVLSACETALPGVELPDEVVALPTGLLQAGVAGVVASQWSVPDLSTAMLMAEFYRRWGSRRSAAS